jgi:hypothetical protein
MQASASHRREESTSPTDGACRDLEWALMQPALLHAAGRGCGIIAARYRSPTQVENAGYERLSVWAGAVIIGLFGGRRPGVGRRRPLLLRRLHRQHRGPHPRPTVASAPRALGSTHHGGTRLTVRWSAGLVDADSMSLRHRRGLYADEVYAAEPPGLGGRFGRKPVVQPAACCGGRSVREVNDRYGCRFLGSPFDIQLPPLVAALSG